MSLTFEPPWTKQEGLVVLAHTTTGFGGAVLTAAQSKGLGVGGYVYNAFAAHTKQFKLLPATNLTRSIRLNMLACDGVLVMSNDPRVEATQMLIREAKCRHREIMVLLRLNEDDVKICVKRMKGNVLYIVSPSATPNEGFALITVLHKVWWAEREKRLQ